MSKAYTPPQLKFAPTFAELWEQCRYSIPEFSRRFLDVDPFPHQVRWFNEEVWATERSFVAGNRSGKSISAAIKHLHHILFQTRRPKYAGVTQRYIRVNLSLTLDMANIPFQWAVNRAMDSPLYRQFVLEDECKSYPFPVLVVGDGKKGRKGFRSELWARSSSHGAKYLLGKDIDGVNFDEAAFDPAFLDVVNGVLLMRLADRSGQLDYTTSPNGKNQFYEHFMKSQVDPEKMIPPHYFFGMTASSYDNLAIDHDRLKVNEARFTEAQRLQNIMGVFADVNGIFSPTAIENCYRDVDYSLPIPPVSSATYLKSFDFGFKHDRTVGIVARTDVSPAQIVFIGAWGGEGSGQSMVGEGGIYEQVSKVHHTYPGPIYGDSTGPGGKLILETLTMTYGIPMKESDVAGQRGKAKENLILAGRQALEGRKIIFPYHPTLVNELLYYVIPDENIVTDHVFSFCILAEGLRKESFIEELLPEPMGIFSTRRRSMGDGGCNCQLTRALDYCLTHHIPVTESSCCGGEQFNSLPDYGTRVLREDLQFRQDIF